MLADVFSIIRTFPVMMAQYNLVRVIVFVSASVLAVRVIAGYVSRKQEEV